MDTDARIATIQHISPIAAQSVIRDSTVSALSAVSVATVEVSHFSVLRLPGQHSAAGGSYRKWFTI